MDRRLDYASALWTRKAIRLSKTAVLGPTCFGSAALDEQFQNLVELIGIEPTTSGLQSPRSPS